MRKILLLIFLWATPCALMAQVAINEGKQHIENSSQYFPHKFAAASKRTSTDSTYSVMLRGEVRPEDVYFVFDKDGKCKFQSFQFECDTCCKNLYKFILRQERWYNWHAVAANTYWSTHNQVCMVYDSLHNNISLRRIDYEREVYRLLLNQKEKQYKFETKTGG